MRVVKELQSDDWMPVMGSIKLAEHFRQTKHFPIKTLYRGVLGQLELLFGAGVTEPLGVETGQP